jgi:hypothetical protein
MRLQSRSSALVRRRATGPPHVLCRRRDAEGSRFRAGVRDRLGLPMIFVSHSHSHSHEYTSLLIGSVQQHILRRSLSLTRPGAPVTVMVTHDDSLCPYQTFVTVALACRGLGE